MSRVRRNSCWIAIISALLIALGAVMPTWGGTLTVELQASPDPVARGALLTYTVTIENTGTDPQTDLVFEDTLPTGIDQWNAEYRLDGGGWSAYPESGLISLGTLAGGVTLTVEIQATVEHSAPGTLPNTVTVRDNTGPLESATLPTPTNVLPSVDAGANRMVGLGEQVTLSDASAGDGGSGIASYSWTDSGSGGSFDDPNAFHPTYTAPTSSGLITLTLTVIDNQGGQASDSLGLQVNAFPTVDAGIDRSVDEGGTVALDDATAGDIDGWIVSYSWSDNGAGGQFDNSRNLHPYYTAPATDNCAGESITLTLTVTDNRGSEASDTLVVHVNDVNGSPSANAGPDRSIQEGKKVTLTGSGSDGDGTIVGFAWEKISGPPISLHGANTSTLTFTAPAVSSSTSLCFGLTVTDNCGARASDEVVITINPVVPPAKEISISVVKVADRTTAMLGERVTYNYTVTNTGEVTLFEVMATDDKLGEINLVKRTLAPRESTTGTATTTVEQEDFPGPLMNTIVVSGHDENGIVVTAEAIAWVDLVLARSSIEVVKEAERVLGLPLSPLSPLSVGETITYVYTVTNTGETVLTDLSAMDDQLGKVPLARATLAPWESTSGRLDKTVSEEDLPGPLENTVVVTATDPSRRMVTDTDRLVLLGVSSESALELTKQADITQATVGDTITYTYTIINTGNVTITDLELIDDKLGTIPLPIRLLAPGKTLVVTATYTVRETDLPGPLTNVAAISGIEPLGQETVTETTVSVFLSGVAGGGGAVDEGYEGRVVISEVAWAGTPADPDDEWIELCNLGMTPVDLTGWSLCWYPKGPAMPDRSRWTKIELSGTISPSSLDLSNRPKGRPEITFLKRKGDDLSWLVFDMSWWVAGKEGSKGRGYYTLERHHDATVSNVSADLIYDLQQSHDFELSDKGVVLLLLNAQGEVVDTANAENPERDGWTAGDAGTYATMERSNLLAEDADTNWHTNPGILVCGLDAVDNQLAATCGKPNSPEFEELTFLANAQVFPHQAGERVELSLGQAGEQMHPWIRVTALGVNAAGGGGTASEDLAFSGEYTKDGYQFSIDTSKLAPGTYYFWITGKEREVILIPITITH